MIPLAAVNQSGEAAPVAVPTATLAPVVQAAPTPGAPGASPAAAAGPANAPDTRTVATSGAIARPIRAMTRSFCTREPV